MNPGTRIWVGIPGLDLDGETARHLEELRPGGVILFGRNFRDPVQLGELIVALRSLLGDSVLISIDQEGGRVVRLTEGVTVFPGNMSLAATALGDRQPALDLAYRQGRVSGHQLRSLGIDINLAPCVDLLRRSDERGIGSRSFGADDQLTSALAAALGRGHREEGVHDCWKHYPGIGRSRLDPHHRLPRVPAEGSRAHLRPFIAAATSGASIIMTSHVVAEALDGDLPVTFSSKAVAGRLRSTIGFDGVITSDCLEMGALSSVSFEEIARRTASAGHDVLLVSHSADRQRIARDVIGALEGDQGESHRRLETLAREARIPSGSMPEDGEALAGEIAEGGVTLLRGTSARIPRGGKWLLVLPSLETTSPVEDPSPGEKLGELESLIKERCEVIRVSSEPTSEQIAEVARGAAQVAGLIVALKGARKGGGQAELARGACQWHRRVIFLLLEDPRDLIALGKSEGVVALTAYGFRPVHQRALARVLLGEFEATGTSPVGDLG